MMGSHSVSQNNIQYIVPGQENALRVEESTELIYLEEGAELNTHIIDGVEYLFVDENQQIVDPDIDEGDLQYTEQGNKTCVEYLQTEDGDPMQYINTSLAEGDSEYVQFKERTDVAGEQFSEQTQYLDPDDEIKYYMQTEDNAIVQDSGQIEYIDTAILEEQKAVFQDSSQCIEAPTLDPQVSINSVSEEYSHYHYLEPPTLELESTHLCNGKEYNEYTNNELETNQEPIYIHHGGILYQINDPALMTPEALETIKSTLLDQTSEGDSDKENSTESTNIVEDLPVNNTVVSEEVSGSVHLNAATLQGYTIINGKMGQNNSTPKDGLKIAENSTVASNVKDSYSLSSCKNRLVSLLSSKVYPSGLQESSPLGTLGNDIQTTVNFSSQQVHIKKNEKLQNSNEMLKTNQQVGIFQSVMGKSSQLKHLNTPTNIRQLSPNLPSSKGHSSVSCPGNFSVNSNWQSLSVKQQISTTLNPVPSERVSNNFQNKTSAVLNNTLKHSKSNRLSVVKSPQNSVSITGTVVSQNAETANQLNGLCVKKVLPQNKETVKYTRSPHSTSVKKLHETKSSTVISMTFNGSQPVEKCMNDTERLKDSLCNKNTAFSSKNNVIHHSVIPNTNAKSKKSVFSKFKDSQRYFSVRPISSNENPTKEDMESKVKFPTSLPLKEKIPSLEKDKFPTSLPQKEKKKISEKVNNRLSLENYLKSKLQGPPAIVSQANWTSMEKKCDLTVKKDNSLKELQGPPAVVNQANWTSMEKKCDLTVKKDNSLKELQGPPAVVNQANWTSMEKKCDLTVKKDNSLKELQGPPAVVNQATWTSMEKKCDLNVKKDNSLKKPKNDSFSESLKDDLCASSIKKRTNHVLLKTGDILKSSDFMCQVNMESLIKPKNMLPVSSIDVGNSKISDTQRTYDHKVHRGTQSETIISSSDNLNTQFNLNEEDLLFDMECEEIKDKPKKGVKKNKIKKEKTLTGRGSQSSSPDKKDNPCKTSLKKNERILASEITKKLNSTVDDNRSFAQSPDKISTQSFYKTTKINNVVKVAANLNDKNCSGNTSDNAVVNKGFLDTDEKLSITTDADDSTYRYEVGQDCKAKHADGNIYDGIITQVDASTKQCYIDFLDKGCAWCDFKDVDSQVVEEDTADNSAEDCDIFCSMCNSGDSRAYNEIVLCDACGLGYHQTCHNPPIDCSVILDFESEWVCSVCRPPTPPGFSLPPLPYEPLKLTWNELHTENMEKCYCYCGETGNWFMQMLQCRKCQQWFHQDCVSCLKEALILGDQFYVFICLHCNRGTEFLHRLHLRWVDIAHLALFHLSLVLGKRDVHLDEEVWPWVNKHWKQVQKSNMFECSKQRRLLKLQETLTDVHWKKRFRNGREVRKDPDLWSLRVRTPPPAPVVKMPLMKPLTRTNTAKFKWKVFNKLPNGPCESINWKIARPAKLRVHRKRKLSTSDNEGWSKKRKITATKYEINEIQKVQPTEANKPLLERLIPVPGDYEFLNNPFLLEVEKTELEKRGLWKSQTIERSVGVTLLTVTDSAMQQDSFEHEVEDEVVRDNYLVLAKRNVNDQLHYLINWSDC